MAGFRIVLDADRCCSAGMCESFAPDIFEVDDDGLLVIHDETPPPSAEASVRTAVASCPTAALSLAEE
ncbi:ferredoxin [Nocardioides sp.]|uniref:ferredoxin n=1 Tax=Nocardioides sp. TaxID=35761 RepID=UPI003517FBE1